MSMDNSSASQPELVESSDNYEQNLLAVSKISPASKKEQAEITTLVQMWEHDTLDKNEKQGTWYEYKGKKIAWRLDCQKNGAFKIDGLYYYGFAVQAGKNVYSNVQVPYLFFLGRNRIREAFIKSMNELKTVRILLPDKGQPQPPKQDDPKARKPEVAELKWRMHVVGG